MSTRSKKRVPPHDPETEPRPIHALSQFPAREAERLCCDIIQPIVQFLDNTSYKGEEVPQLRKIVRTCIRVGYDPRTAIKTVVKGATSAGKTSLINSLIGHKLGDNVGPPLAHG